MYRNGKIYKVPATKMEVVSNGLLGLFEKRRMINFLMYLQSYDEKKPETHKGRDLTRMTMRQLYDEYGFEKGTAKFVGHAMALQLNDDYMDRPALSTVKAIIMYCYSVDRYGKSPYVYPMYGLGGLPEGFSRLCAIHGGTFMLNRSVDEVLFDNEGKAWGIRGDDEIAKAKIFIGDPSYFQPYQKCREIGKVVRSICFLNHPIPNTNDVDSLQIIIPSTQLNRKNDIYVVLISNSHQVTAPGKYVAICSTVVETSTPMRELAPALGLLGTIMTRFDDVVPLYEPLNDGRADNCYISKSFDATSHFETTSLDVIDMYERITGEVRSGQDGRLGAGRGRVREDYPACINGTRTHHLSATPRRAGGCAPRARRRAPRAGPRRAAPRRSSTRSTPRLARRVEPLIGCYCSSRRPPRVLAQHGERIRAALASDGRRGRSGCVAAFLSPRVVLGDDVVEFAMWRESRPVDAVDAPSSMPYQTVAVRHECDAVLWYRLRKHALGTVDAVVRVAPCCTNFDRQLSFAKVNVKRFASTPRSYSRRCSTSETGRSAAAAARRLRTAAHQRIGPSGH